MARLLEHQGKDLLRRKGMAVPAGRVVRSVPEAREAAAEIGYPVVVKAQIPAGRRGKAGGVRFAQSEEELTVAVSSLLSAEVNGLPVESLLVEKQVSITREVYVAITADPRLRSPVALLCLEGGVDIEETIQTRPEAMLKFPVDILRGLFPYDVLNLLRDHESLSSGEKLRVAQATCLLYEVYRAFDAKLVEVNPLGLTADEAVALDARIDLDDDALARHPELQVVSAEEAGTRGATLLEQIAAEIDRQDHRGSVHFVQIDPDLSYARQHGLIPFGFDCVGAGASLTMMDELVPLGFYPVNFCDSSGNPVGSKLYRITKVIFSQPGIEGYVFVSCVSSQQLDNTARGIIKALKELYPETGGQPNIPTILAFRGAWEKEALQLLAEHGISQGKWVRVMGREATEKDVAEAFHSLYWEWRSALGGGA
jgi:succinyl-CoA synthetase beta subunit